MSWLPSSFQNIWLTRLICQKQNTLTSIMSQLRSAKRESETVEKNINNWMRTQQNMARSSMNASIFNIQASSLSSLTGQPVTSDMLANNPGMMSGLLSGLSTSQQAAFNTNISNQTSMMQSSMQTYLNNIQQEAEMMKEIQLEPLKDLASDLEVKKETTESDIKLYQSWKEGAKQDLQASAKNLTPNYGGNNG